MKVTNKRDKNKNKGEEEEGEVLSVVAGTAERMECEMSSERAESVCSEASGISGIGKRKRTMGVSEDRGESQGADELESMRAIGEKLRKYLLSDANRISKVASEFILSTVGEYEEQLMRMMCKNERMNGRLDELMRVNRDVNARSYASMVGTSKSMGVRTQQSGSEQMNERAKTYAVVVKANYESTSEQVKEKVMRNVSKTLNVLVTAIRKMKSGGVAIETVSENEVKKLKECEKFRQIDLRVEMPWKIGPKLLVYDVSNEVTNEELLEDLFHRNMEGRVCGEK